MYLTPTEEDRLAIFTAAELARRSLADGARLNAPEATAMICDEMHRAARSGRACRRRARGGPRSGPPRGPDGRHPGARGRDPARGPDG